MPNATGVLEREKVDSAVEASMAKLREQQHEDYDTAAAALMSEELVRAQLKKDGFSQEELAELDQRIGNSTIGQIAARRAEQQKDVAELIMALSIKCDKLSDESLVSR